MSESDLEKLSQAVADLDQDLVEMLTRKLLDKKVEPSIIIEKGLANGIREVGQKYEEGKFFLAELMYGANVFDCGYRLVEPWLQRSTAQPDQERRVVVLGTVAGDIHSIGKDIVKAMLMAAGLTVHDLGVDVSVGNFVNTVRDSKARVLGASALLTSTIPVQQQVIEKLEEEGLRRNVKVVVGGAATTETWARKIRADAWGSTAASGVRRILELLELKGDE